jgi:hypothetical protein
VEVATGVFAIEQRSIVSLDKVGRTISKSVERPACAYRIPVAQCVSQRESCELDQSTLQTSRTLLGYHIISSSV